MNKWRANRLDELLTMKQQESGRRRSPSKRKYGNVVTVDPVGYLDAIEKVHQDTTVVVLIYDDEVSCPPGSIVPRHLLIIGAVSHKRQGRGRP